MMDLDVRICVREVEEKLCIGAEILVDMEMDDWSGFLSPLMLCGSIFESRWGFDSNEGDIGGEASADPKGHGGSTVGIMGCVLLGWTMADG
jgi:hypothetical protein